VAGFGGRRDLFERGAIVRRRSTGEVGVVLGLDASAAIADISLPSGRAWVPLDELEPAEADPAERVARGELGASEPYSLFLQARFLKHAYRFDPLSGLSNARIEPTLHQVYIAHRVTQKLQPRMILADEVGLGKTIEAGLIIKELRARELIERVLVVCPASLQLQWQQELRSKFNEEFEIFDSAALKFLGTGGRNPWVARDNVICSLPFAANPKRAERIIEADWDLVVFDEAHRVRRWLQSANKVSVTQAYRLGDELKELVNGLLLLTATPMQLHPFELYSLIELVEPGLHPTFAAYESAGRELPALNDLMKALKGWDALSDHERELVKQRHGALLEEIDVTAEELSDRASRETAMNALAQRHPLAQVLVRNRKAEVGGFMRREARSFFVDLTEEEFDLYQDITEYLRRGYNRARAEKQLAIGFVMVTYQKMLASSSYAIRQSLRRRIERLRIELQGTHNEKRTKLSKGTLDELAEAEELSASLEEAEAAAIQIAAVQTEIAELERLVERLGQARDSKTSELLRALKPIFDADIKEKVLIFTQFIETQEFLMRALEMNGMSVATFNGRMSLDEKELAVRRFRDPDGAQILVSTEAGGEGRNFQFAHILVNYDLPWNPMKVEQRIGRLDRIGQSRPVFIYNLACRDTVEERVLDVLATRIRLFEESVGSLDPILGSVESQIEQIVMADVDHFGELLEEFQVSLEQRVREAREREQTLADFAMDRSSLRRDVANELLERSPLARTTHLEDFVAGALEYFGGTMLEHPEGGVVVTLSPRLATRLRTRSSTRRGVFSPTDALRLEELDFFAFGHDLIDGIVDLPLTVDPTAAGVRRLEGISEPSVEILYEIRVGGLRPSGRILHHLVGEDLFVQSSAMTSIPEGPGPPQPPVIPPPWTRSAIEASRQAFAKELALVRDESREQNQALKEEELARTARIYDYRRIRLDKIIGDQRDLITDVQASGSESRRRILPALEGRLAKAVERRDRLVFEHEQAVEAIESREVSVEAEVLAAGLVVP
jgi:superfamily II DNA or RNA helicase